MTPNEEKETESGVQIDYLEITAPFYEQWPPESHTRIFIDSKHEEDEEIYAREVLAKFMPRAWRRPVTPAEVDRHMALFNAIRPKSHDFQEAVIEVLATVLASPQFLYLVQLGPEEKGAENLSDYELATRLSMFLWCSLPDEELLKLASKKKLKNQSVLRRQTRRMLADPRSERFSKHFVKQWLGMQLLDFLDVDEELYPQFDADLRKRCSGNRSLSFRRSCARTVASWIFFIPITPWSMNGLPDITEYPRYTEVTSEGWDSMR